MEGDSNVAHSHIIGSLMRERMVFFLSASVENVAMVIEVIMIYSYRALKFVNYFCKHYLILIAHQSYVIRRVITVLLFLM